MSQTSTSRLIIGCGYLGRRVADRWLNAGDEVAALTRSADRAQEFRKAGIQPIVGDILEPEMLRALPEAATVLYAVGYDRTGEASKREVYVAGLRNVLSCLPPSVERFLYVSSTSVYGQSNGERVDEASDCDPTSESGRICLDAERRLRKSLGDRVAVQVLRLSGIYGPGRLIARLDALRENRPLPGPPDGWLNLIHVADAASLIVRCAEQNSASCETLLVSDNRPVQRHTYYESLANLIGAPPPRFEPAGDWTTDLGKRCNNRRLRVDYGMSLAYPTIAEGLPAAITNDVQLPVTEETGEGHGPSG